MTARQAMAAAALAALAGGVVYASDETILGKSFTVKNPDGPERRKIVVIAREVGSPNNVVGDPTANGATLTVIANGANSTSQTFVLGQGTASTGKPFWTAVGTTGFKYKDSKGDNSTAVRQVLVKKSPSGTFTLKAKIAGKLDGGTSVVPPNPGSDGCAILSINAGDAYHVKFGSDSIIKNVVDKLFRAKRPQTEGTCNTTTTTTTSTSLTIPTLPSTTTTTTTTTGASTTTTTLYGSPSRAFVDHVLGLLD